MGYTREDIDALLAARMYLYSVAQGIFGNAPDSQLLEAIDEPLLKEAASTLALDEQIVSEFRNAVRIAPGEIEGLRDAYTRLFIGPAKLSAPPWESVYRTQGRVIFQRETLDVRNAYRAQGFLPTDYPRIADDHIALECGFLAALGQRMLDHCKAQRKWEAEVEASIAFLDDHLLVWIGRYANDLRKANAKIKGQQSELYGKAALFIEAVTQADRLLLDTYREIEQEA